MRRLLGRFLGRRSKPNSADALCREAAAFLSGSLGAELDAPMARQPWSFVNQLAHAEVSTLQALAGSGTDANRAGWSTAWDRAVSYLAFEMLLFTDGNPDRLWELQRCHLVPIELEWIETPGMGRSLPSLVAQVRGCLGRARRPADRSPSGPTVATRRAGLHPSSGS